MEEARTTRARVQAILAEITALAPHQEPSDSGPPPTPCSEDCLSSREWLSQYGLKAQKLLLYDALSDCAFRHSDGVVDLRAKPEDESVQTDAETNHKLVNAKYCSRFAHMKWKDGSVVHVHVTAEKCRWYEDQMRMALANMQRRLDWLCRGSRELFGAVLEEQVYVLVDTSESMKDQLPLLKAKIHQLMKEQLRHKAKVNFVKFGSRAVSWRERLAGVNEQSLENAWTWIKGLQAGGSTNTLGALQLALADIGTQAVYLLTDGRPDQPTGTVLAEVQLCPPVPVHTISFNCKDMEANRFLYTLAQETGGRYHCYQRDPEEPGTPLPYVSEDIHLLKAEIEQGKENLEKVLKLRAECVMLDWYHNGDNGTAKRSSERPHSAPRLQKAAQGIERARRPQSVLGCVPASRYSHPHHLPTAQSRDRHTRQAQRAAHTKASLLRFLSHGVSIADKGLAQEWMLPETLSLFQTNTDKQSQVLHRLELTAMGGSQKKPKRKSPKESLDMSSAQWLRTNSLVARRLTIIDALAPTAVPQSAKFIPILEKHIYSKVFDEVFPLAHLSSGHRLTLVNPLGVNLEDYKTRLQGALQDYQRRLDLIVWRALTEEDRAKFGSDKPLAFLENREALLQMLEAQGWPLPSEDISLLEDQINMGLSFLQQASDLQKAARQKASTQDNDAGSRMNSANRAQRTRRRRALDTLRGQRVIARSEADEFYYSGTVRKRLPGKRVLVDFSRGDTEIVPLGAVITTGGAGPCPPLTVGDFVLVDSGTEGVGECFVPGVVIATPRRLEAADKLFTVLKYNNRKVHCVRSKMVKISQTRYNLTCRCLREQHRERHRMDHKMQVELEGPVLFSR
ncbi:von Willebrand factor A domain-containing protein 3B-like [Megalops cyprinoides]|uniref:von Willebrand factor A domain-containing protein 3B-like n=1 Tax=Megalops cyprinoides TaxID=118141 RepID=UPI001863DF82|nr:von Willebrand factor A domain-containing protein 3B-like [Megalops cyprinoides]